MNWQFLAGVGWGVFTPTVYRFVRFAWLHNKARISGPKTTAETDQLRNAMHERAKAGALSVIDYSLTRAADLDKAFNGFANAIKDHYEKLTDDNPKNAITPEGVTALAAVSVALVRETWVYATLRGHEPRTELGPPPSDLN